VVAIREVIRQTNDVTVEPSGDSPVTVEGARALARLAKSAEMALGGVDLSLPQYRVLIFLADHDAAAASALAARLDVTRPTITAIVDGLVARGFVERRPAQDDRRRVEHHLTAAGEQVLHDGDQAVIARLGSVAAHLDPEEVTQAAAGLERWGDGLNRARAAFLHEADAGDAPALDGAGRGT
jgi:long-chain acyl-CoA synthetase